MVILRELNLSLKPESLPSVDELLDQGWKWWYDGSSLFHERTGQDIDSRLVGWLGKELSSVPEPDLSRILRVTDLVGSEVYD